MITSTEKTTNEVSAVGVRFSVNELSILLSDGRTIGVPLERVAWLRWLLNASPEQRSHWHLEPGGFAIYWDDLDDGIEIGHLLSTQPIR
jgi:hypothetical protein